jgi:predicted nucleotidyltransferase
VDLAEVRTVLVRYWHLYLTAYVFGFTARGDNHEWSDVDLILVRRAELLIYTEAELRELVEERRNAFLHDALTKGVRIEGTQNRSAPVAPAGRE